MIRFGTSGWRAIISDEFTFRNVRLVTQAIADTLRQDPRREHQLVVGYDTRFLSERMAREAAGVLSASGVAVLLGNRDAPAPAVSLEIRARGAAGALYFTASRNPPEYNGLKLFDGDGAPAGSELTDRVEMEVLRLESRGRIVGHVEDSSRIEEIDLQERYLEHLIAPIDTAALADAGLGCVVDARYGTSREYLDRALAASGCEVRVRNNYVDPYFGGYSPDCSADNLAELCREVRETDADLGLATDGDGDRFGIVDGDGTFLSADEVLPMLLDYLAASERLGGRFARSVATSHRLDAVAAAHDLGIVETAVGFKHIARALTTGEAAGGGEESGGFGLGSHLPSKDGMLACLLVAEMRATVGRPLSELRRDLEGRFGPSCHRQTAAPLTPALEERLAALVRSPPDRFAGRPVAGAIRIDGLKLLLAGGGWLLLRRSGTEPLLRAYAEASDEAGLDGLLAAASDLVGARVAT